MQYRVNPRNGESLSQLGFGCMRFPRKSGQVDMDKVTAMVQRAIERGVNYFDTAYIYPGSEEALGRALKALNKRDEVRLATKLPPYLCKSAEDFDRIFNKQLSRLKTDRIDYYLIHMLADTAAWERLKRMGIERWIAGKKESGEIINIGFSFHGGRAEFKRIIDAYDWGFCMVQYNYLDEHNQAGREGVCYAHSKSLPVFVMEPLRGGMLVNGLPKAAAGVFAEADSSRTLADWALSWVYDQPEVTLLLSGMNEMRQLEENIALASRLEPGNLTDTDRLAYKKALEVINSALKIPCTKCNYCMPCPHNVDIPTCFAAYNESYAHGFASGMRAYFMTTGAISAKQSNASLCRSCGKCEKNCPQAIKISERLADVSRRLEGFWFRPVSGLARRIMFKTRS